MHIGYFIINLLIVAISIICRDQLAILSLLGLVQIIYCTISVYKVSSMKVSLGIVYPMVLYLFHSGLGLLYLLDPYFFDIALYDTTQEYYILAQIFTELCVFMYPIGYKAGRSKKNFLCKHRINDLSYKPFVLFFLISVPFYLMATKIKIDVGKTEGYLATFELSSTPLFHYFSLFINAAIPLAILLIIFFRDNKKICNILSISVFVINVYSMTSGHRITAILYIITLAIVYFNIVTELTKKNVFVLLILIASLVVLLPIVSNLRTYGDIDSDHIATVVDDMKSDDQANSIISFLDEFGGSVVSLALPIKCSGNQVPYLGGLTYIISPIRLFPIIPFGIAEEEWYKNASTFVWQYPEFKSIGGGGSCLGELYANFGWLGWLAMFFIGYLVRLMDNAIFVVKRYGYISFPSILLIWLIPGVIGWIRGYFYLMVSFVFVVLYFLWTLTLKKNSNYQNKYILK